MCSFIIKEPIKMLLGSLGEVAGKTAEPGMVENVRQSLQHFLQERPYTLRESIVTKLGRVHFVVSYIRPDEPVPGNMVDTLWEETNRYLNEEFGLVKSEVIIVDQPPLLDHE